MSCQEPEQVNIIASGTRMKLEVENLSLSFGGVQALSDVSMEVRDGEILAIIGPNGAGKTALLNCINGYYHPDSGDIRFEGKPILRLPTHKRAQLGIARVFQGIQTYYGMSTLDNMMTGRHVRLGTNPLGEAIYFGRARLKEIAQRRRVEEIIDFLEIQSVRKAPAASLPYGVLKRIDLGRALCMEPTLLLLDEPTAGMNVEEKEDIARFILDISEEYKTTMILVEHDMGVVMDLVDRIVVLDFGKKIAEGTAAEIRHDAKVIAAYLGEED